MRGALQGSARDIRYGAAVCKTRNPANFFRQGRVCSQHYPERACACEAACELVRIAAQKYRSLGYAGDYIW